MRFSTLCPSSPEKDSPSSVSEKVSRSKSSPSPRNVGSFFKKKKTSPHGPYFFGMFHLLPIVRIPTTIPRTQKGPHPFPAGPCPNFSQTLRAFFDDFLIVFAIFLASGPNVDVAVLGSHTSTNLPSQETSFRLTQRCFRRHHLETPSPRQGQYQMCRNLWIHHSFVAGGALSPCSRNSWALDSAAVWTFLGEWPTCSA